MHFSTFRVIIRNSNSGVPSTSPSSSAWCRSLVRMSGRIAPLCALRDLPCRNDGCSLGELADLGKRRCGRIDRLLETVLVKNSPLLRLRMRSFLQSTDRDSRGLRVGFDDFTATN